jgi:hypothetical protein
MRALLPLPFLSILALAAPPAVPLDEAAHLILQAYDENPALESLPSPAVKPQDRLGRDWLLAALREDAPKNPFPAGGKAHREAEAFRHLLEATSDQRPTLVRKQPLALPGTQAGLWRWGKAAARRGEMSTPLRQAWEDRLLAKGIAPIIRGWALRHAFCFALAKADEARFTQLKEACEAEAPELAQSFQKAFALLGGPPPRVYLWSLPDLEALDIPLSRLGHCLAITPLEPDTPHPPIGCTWIIPCMTSNQPVGQSALQDASLEEGRRIAEQVRSLNRAAYLAPSREPFLSQALAYFPIEIRLNDKGLIESIRMGDAALQARPTP